MPDNDSDPTLELPAPIWDADSADEKSTGDDDKAEELVIKEGQTVPISSGARLKFKSIRIDAGGTLVIIGPTKNWTCLRSNGDFRLAGTIVVRDFDVQDAPAETVEDTAPDGEELKYTYRNNRAGGAGGRGGGWPSLAGGAGAAGDGVSGGGGGGGAASDGRRNGDRAVGGAASGRSGGGGGHVPRPGRDGGAGGTSPMRERGDGGLLYVWCRGKFNGTGGSVDLRGADGLRGGNGATAFSGGGGAAGGTPGFNGGAFVLRVRRKLVAPSVQTDGGAAGQPGSPGGSTGDWVGGYKPNGAGGGAAQAGNAGEFEIRE